VCLYAHYPFFKSFFRLGVDRGNDLADKDYTVTDGYSLQLRSQQVFLTALAKTAALLADFAHKLLTMLENLGKSH